MQEDEVLHALAQPVELFAHGGHIHVVLDADVRGQRAHQCFDHPLAFPSRQALRDSRNIRECVQVGGGSYGKRPDCSGSNMGKRACHNVERDLNLATDKVSDHGRSTAIGYVNHRDPCSRLEQLARDLRDRAGPV